MRDELPDWMDAPAEEVERPRRRLHRLLALAAIPWVVVAVLVGWRGSGSAAGAGPPATESTSATTEATTEPTTEPTETMPAPSPEDDAAVAHPAPESVVIEEWRGGWREMPGDGASITVAAAVARAWLTGLEPTLAVEGLSPQVGDAYAEHLTVEAIERPGPGAAVVTFGAIVLEPGEPTTARVRRLAVPVDEREADPRPGGPPWELPAPTLTVATPAVTEEVGEEHWPAAEAALRTAGFDDAELRGLQRTSSWPVLASVRTRGPDGPRDQVVWLRRHLDQFVVAGLPLSQALPERSQAQPERQDQP